MRPRISIRGSVRPSVGRSVHLAFFLNFGNQQIWQICLANLQIWQIWQISLQFYFSPLLQTHLCSNKLVIEYRWNRIGTPGSSREGNRDKTSPPVRARNSESPLQSRSTPVGGIHRCPGPCPWFILTNENGGTKTKWLLTTLYLRSVKEEYFHVVAVHPHWQAARVPKKVTPLVRRVTITCLQ